MAETAVRYHAPDHPQLPEALSKIIRTKAEKLAAEISTGYCQDWPDYKFRVGKLKALMETLTDCEEAERELSNPR